MKNLFDQTSINGLQLKNRLVRSATWEGMCSAEGRPELELIELYRNLAYGGVGLIISGYAYVSPEGAQMGGQLGMHSDDLADDMRSLTEAVHMAGGKICIQLVHAGGQANPTNTPYLAPSAVKVDQYPETPQELSITEIGQIVEAFGQAARRAKAWNFDAIQLHGAHGYLINEFLSPLTNRRSDAYGGSIEKRCRFMLEAYRAVREAVGDDYPVMIKLNGSDFLEGGLSNQDATLAAQLLDEAGIDAIEVSGGTPASGRSGPVRSRIDQPSDEAYNLELARSMRVSCPLMSVGGFRSFNVAEDALELVDYVALSRPLVRQSDLPNLWQRGKKTRATCISCNGCFKAAIRGGIYCVQEASQ